MVQDRVVALFGQHSIAATEAEIEGAAVLHLLSRFLHAGDFAACETLAPRAFEPAREHQSPALPKNRIRAAPKE